MSPRPCTACGASGRLGSCTELFHRLLALDHQRLEPWGEFHGLNVACFHLQHPEGVATSVLSAQWQVTEAFLNGGLEAAHEWERRWRAETKLRGGHPGVDVVVPAQVRSPVFTIEDLSSDGTFPAQGYVERVTKWAESVHHERSGL